MLAPVPADESARLAALNRYEILDSPPEAAFDDLTAIASQVCGYPIAVMSLVDRDRQWFKSRVGVDVQETPRALAFCAHAILQPDLFEIPNAADDPRFADNELVTSGPGIRAYAGMPLETPEGHRLGTLCVIDRVPRALTATQRDVLQRLANQAVALLEARAVARQLKAQSVRLQQFASVVERTSNAVVITDAHRRVTWVNPAFERMSGYASAEVIGASPGRLLQFDQTDPAVVARIRQALDQRVPVRELVLNRAKDGRAYWNDLDIQPVFDAGGAFTGYCAVENDVTALVGAHAAQRRRLERSEAVSRLRQVMMADGAPREILSQALDAAVALTGSTHGFLAKVLVDSGQGPAVVLPQAVVNANWSEVQRDLRRATVLPPVSWPMLDPHVREVLASGNRVVLNGAEARVTGINLFDGAANARTLLIVPISVAGTTVALLALANRPDDYDPDVIDFLAPVIAVVSEFLAARRQAEARHAASMALEQERRRLRLALLASNVGVFELDLASGVVSWDARMWEIHGLVPQTTPWTMSDWVRLLHADDADRVVDELVGVGDSETLLQTQYRVVQPDGTVRVLRANGQVFRGDGARMLVGVNLDVTQDVELHHELEAARQTAESAAVAKSQFLATMSHEIRTPMNGVLGMLELLLRSPLDEEQRDRAQMAHGSAEALLHIINDILDLSKLEAEQVQIETLPYEPRQVLVDTLALLASRADDKGLALRQVVDDTVPSWIRGDPTRLRQILLNLVGNAIKFTTSGHVAVRMRMTAGLLSCEVEDTGEGIAPEAQARLFQRFMQADASTTRRFGGTGLGLAICRQLVALMGGEIGVRSTPGHGSTFWFTVAASSAVAPAVAPSAAPLPQGESILPSVPPLRILAADDNVVNQRLLRAFLAPAKHDVVLVGNGLDVLEALATREFDLVLMDIQMPGMDGVSCTRAIRAQTGRVRDVPIVALTANAMAGDRERYLADGFTDYVSKPLTMGALAGTIARIFARDGAQVRSA
ncbi:ATP-binding protein [Luteitalea sp.]